MFPVAMRLGVTPVPIPNTTVKPQAAESTTLETTWEARWLPEPLRTGKAKSRKARRRAQLGILRIPRCRRGAECPSGFRRITMQASNAPKSDRSHGLFVSHLEN